LIVNVVFEITSTLAVPEYFDPSGLVPATS
jgi:hypothetical protein